MAEQIADLLLLGKEVLKAKYLEVSGKKPLTTLTKEQLAEAIATATEPKQPHTEEEAHIEQAKAEQAKAEQAKAEQVQDEELPEEIKPTKKTVHLVKYESGEVIDEMIIEEAVYNNLPKGAKSEWSIKKPDEIAGAKK